MVRESGQKTVAENPPYLQSIFGRNLGGPNGISELMDDLGSALALGAERIHFLGGGNPAAIPEVQALWRDRMNELLADGGGEFDRMVSNYDDPAGSPRFREAMAAYLRREFGWEVTRDHIAVTCGGQTAFFFLLNRLAGAMRDGSRRKIVLPVVPEYIGYADLGVTADPLFEARHPLIEKIGEHNFKYRVDFEQLHLDESHGAILISRPTNPSSNVLTDDEVEHLRTLAREQGIPLVIDNAYGLPFPGVIFHDATLTWDEGTILTMSLSKLGLPGTRTGVVVARPDLIRELSAMTAVVGLSNNNIGQALVLPMLESGEISRVARDIVRPHYQAKATFALAMAERYLPDSSRWRAHESEGAFFLWLWFEGLPITSRQLYERAREKGLLIIPGEAFFFGLPTGDPWPHQHECIRVSFTSPPEVIEAGFRILGEVLGEV